MRLQRLTNLEVLALQKEYAELGRSASPALKSHPRQREEADERHQEGADAKCREAYADARRTEVVESFDEIVVEEEKPAADETMVVLSRGGFVKRMPPKSYVRAAASDDAAELPFAVVPAMTDEKLLFFTDLGNCYPVLAAQIPEGKPRDRGITAGGLLAGLDHGERVVALLNAGDWSGELVLATEGGLDQAHGHERVQRAQVEVCGGQPQKRRPAADGAESLGLREHAARDPHGHGHPFRHRGNLARSAARPRA